MVATVVGSRLGLEQTSGWVLGSRGQLGASMLGRGGEAVFVNAATGNMVVRGQDDFLVGLGADISVSRAYNSQGALNDDNGDNWRFSIQRRLVGIPVSPGTAGSTVTRIGEDGAQVVYAWDAGRNAYVTREGAGAYDTLVRNGDGTWTWTDGDTGLREVYDGAGQLNRTLDLDGAAVTFSYEVTGGVSRLASVTTADGGRVTLTWSGDNVTQLATSYYDLTTSSWKSQTRTRYAYDGLNRLTSVTVDLSPEDSSVADGQVYVTTYAYDGTSRRITSIRQTDGSRVDIAYEAGGQFRVTSVTQSIAEGVSRKTTYNYATSTRTEVTSPDGTTTILEHDGAGQLVRITEPAATSGATPQVREFTYDVYGNVTRIKTSPTTWTDFVYGDTNGDGQVADVDADGHREDMNGLWTEQYERTGEAAYIAARRTYNAAGKLLTDTRYQTLDADGMGAGQAADPLTTRYVYDSENHLRFVVAPNGEVTRHDYATDGYLIRTTLFTGAGYGLGGLGWNQSIAEATLDGWAAGLTDKTQAQITEYVYDGLRRNVATTIAYSIVNANGGADGGSPATRTNFTYDRAGRVVSRSVHGLPGTETFVYDGLGRLISAVDFNNKTTTTVFHDALGATVVRTADGLNDVSVFNRAGELVSRTQTERSPNLVDLGGWPEQPDVPLGPAVQGFWSTAYTGETRWQITDGPGGQPIVSMQAGQTTNDPMGGGSLTNAFSIDPTKAYEFVYYFRKPDLARHSVYFGPNGLLENATTGADDANPYFFSATAAQQQALFQSDRWYKVVGYIQPKGSALIPSGSIGGVYDMTTGAKVTSTTTFRWDDTTPAGAAIRSRFFNVYDENNTGFSTHFYKPEVRRTDQPNVNLTYLDEWPVPTVPSGPAAVPGWPTSYTGETQWAVVKGPDGRQVVAMQAGQTTNDPMGGGSLTNAATIDPTKAYEFVYYFRKPDLARHYVYFGPNGLVESAVTGADDTNPYFFSASPAQQQALFQSDRWYKVVGYIQPKGSALIPFGSIGGVYDMTTGAKVTSTTTFRWDDATQAGASVRSRFFNVYDETNTGFSTYFYKPEIRELSGDPTEGLLPATGSQYRYDAQGRLRVEIDPTGRITHHLYDNVGRKVGQVDGDGSLIEYKYDVADRLIATVRYATRLTAAKLESLTDAAGNPVPTELAWVRPAASAEDAWTWTVYDDAGRVIQTINGEGSTTAYVYDGASRLLTQTTYYARISAGAVEGFKTNPPATTALPTADPQGDRTTRYFYDAAGRRIGVLDAEGGLTRTVYDAGGRMVQNSAFATRAAAPLRPAGDLNALLASAGVSAGDIHAWSVYDGRGFLRGTVNGEGEVVLYDYNAFGHVTQVVTGRKLTPPPTSQPSLAQLVAAPASPVVETVNYTRDNYGQVLTETRAVAGGTETVSYLYDDMRRLVRTSVDRVTGQGPDYATLNRYDRRGRVIGQLNGRGAAALAALGSSPTKAQIDDVYRTWGTTFAYDAADRLISRTDPDGAGGAGFTTVYFYDADGALAYEVNALGEVKGYLYDAQNRRTQAIAFATRINTTGLKGGAIVSGLPSRTALSSADSRTVLVYDTVGRVKSSEDANQLVTTYSYDAIGELRGVHTPSGPNGGSETRTVAYDYDRAGRLKRTSDGLVTVFETVFRDAFGRAIQTVDARGVSRATAYDRAGRVVVSKDGLNNQTEYAYDARGNVLTVKDRLGKITSYSSDPHNRTQTVTTPEGLVATTTCDDQGHVLSVVDGAGRRTDYAYDLDGQLLTTTNGLGQTTTNAYDVAGRLYETTDASGRKVRYAYDGAGRALSETVDPGGLNLTTTYVYDAKGQRIRVFDPLNRRTEYQYDPAGRLRYVVVDADGLALTTQYAYDRAGNVGTVREAEYTSAQRDTVYIYDGLGRVVRKQVGPAELNVRSEYVYDLNGNVTLRRDQMTAGQYVETRFVYDAENRLILTVDAAGGVVRTVYDAEGRIVQTIAYADTLTTDDRAALGQAPTAAQVEAYVTANTATDRSTIFVYDADGRLAFTVDPVNALTRTEYDGSGNVVRRSTYQSALPAGTSLKYAILKQLADGEAVFGGGLILPEGARIQAAVYDAAGRQAYSIDPEGAVTAFFYDGAGRVIRSVAYLADTSLTEWGNNLTKAQMDNWVAANAGQGFQKTHVAYDSAGRAVYAVDAAGYVTRTTYNAASLVTEEARFAPVFSVADGAPAATIAALLPAHETTAAKTGYGYDSAGRRTTVVNAMGGTTVTELNGLGKAVKVTDPRGATGFFYYDGAGRLSLQVDPEGLGTTTTYWMGEIVQSVTRHGAPGAGTPTVAARPTFATHPKDAKTTFVRDNAGRVTDVTDAENKTESYVLNAFGDRTSVTNRINGTTTYTYDRRGLVLTETLPVSSVRGDGVLMASSVVNTFSYDVRGNRTRTVEASNIGDEARTTIYEYDRLDRLFRKTSDLVLVTSSTNFSTSTVSPVETIAYDSYGNVIETKNAGGARTLFYYDALNRKVAEIDAMGTLRQWTYDASNNAKSARVYDTPVSLPTSPGGTTPVGSGTYRETLYAYDLANRLTHATVQDLRVGEYGSGYGSSVADVTTQTVYDAAGNAVVAIDGRGVSSYAFYDKLGRQIATVDGEGYLTTWTRDAEGNVLREIRYADRVIGAVTPGRDPATLPPRNFDSSIDRITDFTYDRNGRRLTETRYTVHVYNSGAADRVTAAHATITYAYDGLGGVTRKIEANGDYVDYVYDKLGRQTRTMGAAFVDYQGTTVRRQTDTAYTGVGAVSRIVDSREAGGDTAEARVTSFAYDRTGRLVSTTDATGFTRVFGHDVMGRVTKESYDRIQAASATRTEGRRYEYDLLGRVTHEAAGFNSDPVWVFGQVRKTVYNVHGEVIEKRLGDTPAQTVLQESFAYDKAGRLWRSSGGDGVYKYFVYDKAGRMTLAATPSGTGMPSFGDVEGLVGWLTDNESHAIGAIGLTSTILTFSTYDARGLATGTREPYRELAREPATLPATTVEITRSRTYNAFGEVISETDANGWVTDFFYNTMGRLIESRKPQVNYTTETGQPLLARPTEQYRYDVSGRLIATRTANGHWTERTLLAGSGHGGDDPVVLSEIDPTGGVMAYGVDVFGDVRKITNQVGAITEQTFDKASRLIEVKHPERARQYDFGGTVLLPGQDIDPVTGKIQLIDHYEYDGLGQRIVHWNNKFGRAPIGGVLRAERTDYDGEGRVVLQTDFEGRATIYQYAWDATLQTTGLGTFGGWIKTTNHASGKTGVEKFDSFGRLVGKTDLGATATTGGRVYAMTFDQAGRLVRQTSSQQVGSTTVQLQNLAYVWFNTGQLAEQKDESNLGLGYSTARTQANYAYDKAGNRVRERYATTEIVYLYDPNYDWDPYYGGYTPPTPTEVTIIRQDATATYDKLGRMLSFADAVGTPSAPPTTVDYAYDLAGNIRSITSSYRRFGATTTTTTASWYKYDAMNRMVHVNGKLTNGVITGGTRLEYDAASNRRKAIFNGWVETDITDYGRPVGDPYEPEYPYFLSGPGEVVEHYEYTADGYLARVGQSGKTVVNVPGWGNHNWEGEVVWRSNDVRDVMGRLTLHQEFANAADAPGLTHSRAVTYDRSGLIAQEVTQTWTRAGDPGQVAYTTDATTTYNYLEGSTWRGVVMEVTTTSSVTSGTQPKPTSTAYEYTWWDSAQQAKIIFDNDTSMTHGGISNVPQTSIFGYDVNGRVSYVNIKDGRPRSVTFVTDANGQVLSRVEADTQPSGDPQSQYFYFNGQRVGEITNNFDGDGAGGVWQGSYFTALMRRTDRPLTGSVPFVNGTTPSHGADFDQAYEALTPNSVRGSGTAWTVKTGDTLQSIAAAIWGDSSLWYLIAEANGLHAGSLLVSGQLLTVPAKVGNVHNTSETFRPYDPNKAIGDVNPTQPEPPKIPKKGGCGVVGQIIAVVIAVVVAAIVAPYAAAAIANTFGGATATAAGVTAGTVTTVGGATATTAGAVATAVTGAQVAGGLVAVNAGVGFAAGALAGAAASIASQAFQIATGAQDRFDWRGVGLSALSGGVSGGLGTVSSLSGSSFAAGATRGAISSVITQGVAVATGLQDKFDWTGVAVAAVVSGVSSHIASKQSYAPAFTVEGMVNGLVAGAGGGFAGATVRSLMDGTNFGDNLIAVLPDVIGTTIGNAITAGIKEIQVVNAIEERAERLGIPIDPDANSAELAFLRVSVLQGTSDEVTAETYGRPGVQRAFAQFNASRRGISEEIQYNRVSTYLEAMAAQRAQELAEGTLSPTYTTLDSQDPLALNSRISADGETTQVGDVIVTGRRTEGPGPLEIIENVVGGAVGLTGEFLELYEHNEVAANLIYGTTRTLLSGGGGSALIMASGKALLGSAGDRGVDYVAGAVQQETTDLLMYLVGDNPDFGFTVGAFGFERRITGRDMANAGGVVAGMVAGFMLQQKLDGFVARGRELIRIARGSNRANMVADVGGVAARRLGPRVVHPRGYVDLEEFQRLNLPDARTGRPRPGEASAGVELQQELGIRLRRSAGAEPGDFIIASGPDAGQSVDFMFTMDNDRARTAFNSNFERNWRRGMSNEILEHVSRNHMVPMDMRNLAPQHQRTVMDFVSRLTPEQQARVVYFR
jgi:YD repeat-containing protein